jgi:hypothetical protein
MDHLYSFFMDNHWWSDDDSYNSPYDKEPPYADRIKLVKLNLQKGQAFKFLFDYGDEWRFQCKVLQVLDEETSGALIVRAKGEAPPQYPVYDEDMDEDMDVDVDGQDRARFEDIVAVFVNDVQLIKSSVLSGKIFPNCYYKKDEDNLGLNVYIQPEDTIGKIRIIYRPRPKLKETKGENETISADDYVMLPAEFVELARAKLRGEAYKLANEDLLAAKWLNEYNVLLESFKVWIASKQNTFGL